MIDTGLVLWDNDKEEGDSMIVHKLTKEQIRKCKVVSEAWLNIKNEDSWADLVRYLDLAFPIAFLVSGGMGQFSRDAIGFVEEGYDVLLSSLDVKADKEYESWAEVAELAIKQNPEVAAK